MAASFPKYPNSAKIAVFRNTLSVDGVINDADVNSGLDLMDACTTRGSGAFERRVFIQAAGEAVIPDEL